MSTIDPPAGWDEVDGINTSERLLGGPSGPLNRAVTALTARSKQLREDLDSFGLPDGSALVGFRQAAPGAVVRSVEAVLREAVSVMDFGAVGDGPTDDTAAIQAALNSGKQVFFPRPTAYYRTSATLTFGAETTLYFQDELTEIRMTSGSGFVLSCDGGDVETAALKQVRITGGSISGGDPVSGVYNPDCDGGLRLRGVYMVHIADFHAKCFAKSTARAALLENVFNTAIRDSRFNCGTSKDDKRGGGGLKITISADATWNITQVTLNNNLFQFNAGWGVEVTRDGSTGSIDGLTIDNNGIGHNSSGGVGFTSAQIFAASVSRNHIEGSGAFGVRVAEASCVVDVVNNKIQDAAVAVSHAGIGDVRSNQVTRASLMGDGTKIGFVFTSTANVSVGVNDIDTTWVTAPANRYTRENGARVSWPVFQTTIANFGTFFANFAQTYHGATLIQTDATDFSTRVLQAYSPTGTGGWYRLIGRFAGVQTIGGATPNVGGGAQVLKTGNAAATTMTAMPGGYTGQQLTILFGDANTTVDFTGTTLKGNAGADWLPKLNDSMACTFDGTNWICAVNSTNPP